MIFKPVIVRTVEKMKENLQLAQTQRWARRKVLKLPALLSASAFASAFGLTKLQSANATSRPASQSASPQFTVTVGGAYLRRQPSLTSALTQPIFSGERYVVAARTSDNVWLQLQAPDAGKQGWLLAQYGQADAGVDDAPAPAPGVAAKRGAVALPALPRWVTPVTASARKVYLTKRPGKNLNAFTVIGDCNSVPEAYLGRLAMGLFDVSRYPFLTAIVETFAASFARTSVATFSGFNSGSMFDPAWANPNYCQPGEGLLDCELRRSNASIVFVLLGTGDQFTWQDFEKNYRRILAYALQLKVLPVPVTKPDDLESQQGGAPPGFINDAVRRLGQEYGVPVIDFWSATRNLKDYGMRWEGNGNQNFHMVAEGSDLRIQLTLQTLAAITR